MNKKAQATAFVILGLVVVSLALLLFYFRAEVMEALTKKAITETPVSEEAKKLDEYTKDCLEIVLEEATLTLGAQGGFISLPEDEFPPLLYNMLSNSLDVFNNGALRVPYWYFKTPNNLDKTQIPTKKSMETEIENYIDVHLKNCLNDYMPLKIEGYQISYSQPKTKVTIGNKKIIAETIMDIETEIKEQTFAFSKFKATLNAPLGRLYEKALEVFEYENENYFIENSTLDFMVLYNEIPFSGIDFECSPQSWLKTNVAQDLKNILAVNIPSLKIKSTNYYLTNQYEKALVFDAFQSPEKDTTINFQFSQNWPIMMDIIGEDSEILRGKPFTTENEASRFLLPLFCLNDYHFVYNLKYPVLIALEEDGYIFQFATMAVINNNQPRENKVELPTQIEDTVICSNKPSQIKVIAMGIATDDSSVPLNNVDISLQCLTAECSIGKTQLEQEGYSLTTNFPACINGMLIARKEGYHTAEEIVDTIEDSTIAMLLEPYYELPVSVTVQDTGLRAPYPTEQILFTFENEDNDYFTSFYYPSQDKVKLIAGNYKITSTLMVETKGGFKFQDEVIKVCVDTPKSSALGFFGIKEKKCTEQKIEGTTMDSIVAGGGSYSWYADRKALATSSLIKLYTVRGPTPQTQSELSKYSYESEQFSKDIMKPNLE